MNIYVIGSLANPRIPVIGNRLRKAGHDVFDGWHGAGPEADQCWQRYEQSIGNNFIGALQSRAAQHIFRLDKKYLHWCDAAVMVMSAGKSAHMELGYALGMEKLGYILLNKEPEKYDLMYAFATAVFSDEDNGVEKLIGALDHATPV